MTALSEIIQIPNSAPLSIKLPREITNWLFQLFNGDRNLIF